MRKSAILVVVALAAAASGFLAGRYWPTGPERRDITGESPARTSTYFPVYELDAYTMSEWVPFVIPLADSLPLEEKLRHLIARLSSHEFGRLPMELLRIDNRSGERIAVINLQERGFATAVDKWDQRFQGSTGGAQTQHTLENSILQPDCSGEWIDGVEFYYNGEPFSVDWDHVNLTGVKLRKVRSSGPAADTST